MSDGSRRVSLSVLGPLRLSDAEGREIRSVLSQPKRLALLVYLALAGRDHYRQRDTVVALFWPDFDQGRARAALRQALSWLRRELGTTVLINRGDEEISVSTGEMTSDALGFDEAIAAHDAERAMDLYRGELLEGVFVTGCAPEFEQWLDDERRRRRLQATQAALTLAERELVNDPTVAGEWARKAAGLSPNDEVTQRRVAQLLADSGDRAGALDIFNAYRQRLAVDYETEPSPETEALISQVRAARGPASTWPARLSAQAATSVMDASPPRGRASRHRLIAVVTALLTIAGGVAALVAWRNRAQAAAAFPQAARPGRPPGSLVPPGTANRAAYDLLLKAEHYSAQRTPDGFRLAHGLVKQALDLDPLYADAHALLAETYQGYAWYGVMQSNEAFLKSESSARRAVALDSASALGHAMLAANLSFFRYRWDDGEREFRRAIALDSLNAQVRNFYAIHLRALGRFEEALQQIRRAQDLDQMYRHYQWASGFIFACAGREDSAVVELRRALDFDSAYSRARLELADVFFRQGRFDEGLREWRRTFQIAGDSEAGAVVASMRGEAGYHAARRRIGEINLARLQARDTAGGPVPPFEFGRAFLVAGSRSAAVAALERASSEHDPRLVYLICPEFRDVRDEPRVRAILRRMNLR